LNGGWLCLAQRTLSKTASPATARSRSTWSGRKSGNIISIPVWFLLEGEKLYLLPVHGSDTQWYKNVLKNPTIRIDARGVGEEFRAVPMTDTKSVKSVVEKFREKYGART
jgi:hypothetical protein